MRIIWENVLSKSKEKTFNIINKFRKFINF